ncbi:MAG: hypothetical protein R8M14_09675, partial [Ghiorsea sp.]
MNHLNFKQGTLILAIGLAGISFSQISTASESKIHQQKSLTQSIPDLRNEKDVKTKKRKFFNALRPMVEIENQRIAGQRNFLLGLQQKDNLTDNESSKLSNLVKYYRLERN